MTDTQTRPAQGRQAPPRQAPPDNSRALALVERRKAEFEDQFLAIRGELVSTLGATIDRDRWLAVAADAVLSKPALLECDPLSIIVSLRTAARYGLEPIGELGEGCLVPYTTGGTKLLQFQPMYRGLMKLARNSGGVGQMDAQIVYSNDTFDWQIGTEGFVRHVPAWKRGERLGAYSWARLLSDSSLQIVPLPIDEIEKVRAVSKQYRFAQSSGKLDSLWHLWPDEMAKKTALRRLMKMLPLSATARDLLAYDERADAIEGTAVDITPTHMQISGAAATALERVRANGAKAAHEPATATQARDTREDESQAAPVAQARPEPSQGRCEATPTPTGPRCVKSAGHGGPHATQNDEMVWPQASQAQTLPTPTGCLWRLGQGQGKPALDCTKPARHDGEHSWQAIALKTGGRVIRPEKEGEA